jgi:hypothetical protein
MLGVVSEGMDSFEVREVHEESGCAVASFERRMSELECHQS